VTDTDTGSGRTRWAQVRSRTCRNDFEHVPPLTPEGWYSAVYRRPLPMTRTMKTKYLLSLLIIPMAIALPHAAGAAPLRAGLQFDQSTQMAHLTVPDPCKPRGKTVQGTCKWLLWGDEPNVAGHPVIGYVEKGSGTLSLAAPKLCGVVQYDALVSGSNNIWHFVVGRRYKIDTCLPPPPPPPPPPPHRHCRRGMHRR
jgi:hypothetical protein